MVGHNLNETLIQLIARKATGKGTLINLSVTENGNYDPADEDPPVDGYDFVSVSVETYEDELAQALADLAAAQAQIAELEEKIADYDECCDEAVTLIKLYFPDWSYPPVPTPDPLPPPTPEQIEEGINGAVETHEGYTFPAGTTLPDVLAATGGGDYIQDTTLGIYLSYTDEITPSRLDVYIGYTTSDGVFHQKWQYTNDYASYEYVITSVDGTTGTVYYKIQFTSHGGTVFPWETGSFQDSALIGYGSSGHEYKAKNKE